MSTAHRPNFDPAKGRASKAHLSAQTTKLDLPSHTKLKFRQPPTASNATSSTSSSSSATGVRAGRRDLKRELEVAEWESTNRKRAKSGLEPLPLPSTLKITEQEEDEDEKRRKEAIQKAIELDKSESESSSSSSDEESWQDQQPPATESEDETDEDQDDEQAALLRELEKIKAERLAAKQRSSQLSSSTAQINREEEIARGNPLLNLETALQPSSDRQFQDKGEAGFQVKRRWDDDVIFKNQASAAGNTGGSAGQRAFVNDLTRSEFHKKFMNRYIK